MPKSLAIKEDGKRFVIYQAVIIGCGGNGSHFIRGLCQMVRTYLNKFKGKSYDEDFEVDLTICDKDLVEPHNLNNQLFDETDIGVCKSISLAERYGDHYDLPVKRVTEYVKTIEMLHALFPPLEVGDKTQVIKVLVGMVDNNRSRQLCDDFFHSDEVKDLIYMDAGIAGMTVLNKPESQYTAEDWEIVNASGYSGQIVTGVKVKGEVLLDPVTMVYTDMLEDASSSFPGESCGTLIVNNPQRLMTNQMAAQLSLGVINNLLHTGAVYCHRIEFNSQFGGSRPVFINQSVIEQHKLLLRN